ncbi:putative nuclease HARBI1 [Mytilus edulis]|uniref:putative nuclease HARBI1 n=1 Tax=Mytilus edulis TaxID=6550 RepID=UPI0039EE8EE2
MASRLLYDVQQRHKPRIYREFLGAEPYTECEFQARYRFSKESIQILTNLLNDDLKRSTNRSHAIPVETQIKIALRYYASGSFMQVIGDTFGYDKSTVSRIIQAVTGKFTNIVVKWPGSTHDSFIFRNSDVGIHLDQNHRGFDVGGLLLGDSGYAVNRIS